MTRWLLLLWFVVSFGSTLFAESLNFDFFGWSFGFWVAAQGALIVYVVIVWFYAYQMDRQDK